MPMEPKHPLKPAFEKAIALPARRAMRTDPLVALRRD
jgi:hypothetical protein